MPNRPNTWQARGEYLARCHGRTPQQFASELDTAMRTQGNIAQKPAARKTTGAKSGAGTRTTTRAKTPVGAGS